MWDNKQQHGGNYMMENYIGAPMGGDQSTIRYEQDATWMGTTTICQNVVDPKANSWIKIDQMQ